MKEIKKSDYLLFHDEMKDIIQEEPSISIARVYEDMAETFAKVHLLSWRQAYNNIFSIDYLESVTIDKQKNSFLQGIDNLNSFYFIVKLEDSPIGILHLSKKQDLITNDITGEIVSIYLLKEYCGNGYGRMVIDFAINYLKDNLCTNIFLWVLECNDRAIRAYKKYGFVFDTNQREIFRGNTFKQFRYVLKEQVTIVKESMD